MAILKRKWKGGYTYRVQVYHKRKVVADATFDSKRDAVQFETDVKAKVQAGTYVDKSAAENMTLSEALDDYNETESRNKKNAYVREVSMARQIKKYPIAKLPLASIKSVDVVKFREQRGLDVGENSVRLALALISDLFSVAISEWGMDYLKHPVLHVKKPSTLKTERDRRLIPKQMEYQRLLAAAEVYDSHKLSCKTMKNIIIIAIETAMRESEIASVCVDRIDLDDRIIHIPETKNYEPRNVPLSTLAFNSLSAVLSEGYTPVFNNTASGISKAFTKICRRARSFDGKKKEPLINLHFHDLRHEATSRLFEKGLSTEQVMSITGHKTYSMLKRYTHLRDAKDLVSLLG